MLDLLIVGFLFACTPAPSTAGTLAAQDEKPGPKAKLAPYTAVRFEGATVHVRLEQDWFQLVAVDEVRAADLVAYCKKTWPDKWQKRIGEDLVEVLHEMGHPPGWTVDLMLEAGGERIERKGETLTAEKRAEVWAYSRVKADRVERDHSAEVAPEFSFLAETIDTSDVRGSGVLPRGKAEEDLDQLEWLLENQFSYLRLLGVDFRSAFDAVRAGFADEVPRAAFVIQLKKLVALFGDGHTRLEERRSAYEPPGYLPFLLEEGDEGFVAFEPDRSELVNEKYPYLIMIDGLPIQRWLDVTGRLSATGHDRFVRRGALRNLRAIQYARRELGLREKDSLQLTLANQKGRRKKVTVPVSSRRPIYGDWPRTESRLIETEKGKVGYLRIAGMDRDAEFLNGIISSMDSFQETRGLVVDVRGNVGGSRDALRILFPYFMTEDDPPYIANVAAYRLRQGDDPRAREGFLSNRGLFPAASRRWTDDERRAIEAFAKGFRPDWTPPELEFSDWHYMILRREDSPRAYAYTKPVIVLLDTSGFSATDIFLGALKGWRNVTLMGTTSGGGSGRSQPVRLTHSGIELRVSSMASFRRTGERYDGKGIEPDDLAQPIPTDFIGETDVLLRLALQRLANE